MSELDKAVAYMKQLIDAMTPIAKQAYEIGLTTIRIDAASTILFSVMTFIAATVVLRRIRDDWRVAVAKAALPENRNSVWRSDATNHMLGDGFPYFIGGIIAIGSWVISIANVLNIWLWVKLFSPELWLARKAIEKIVG